MADTALLSWIDVTGQEWNLTDPEGYYVPAPGLQGAFGVPLGVVSFVVPGQPGDYEQYIRIDPNEIRLPLMIQGTHLDDVERARRLLSEAMRPTRGPGILRHVAADGTTRDLYCREVGRMREVAGTGPSGLRVGLIFRAADPYWYDADYSSTLLKPSGSPTGFFDSPFLPIKLVASGVSGGFTIYNNGQAEAWPTFLIHGAGTNPTLTNTTTGEELALTITLTNTQEITIVTNPMQASVKREDNSNQWDTVHSTSTLWPLVPGVNEVQLAMTGTDSSSSLRLLFKARWEGV